MSGFRSVPVTGPELILVIPPNVNSTNADYYTTVADIVALVGGAVTFDISASPFLNNGTVGNGGTITAASMAAQSLLGNGSTASAVATAIGLSAQFTLNAGSLTLQTIAAKSLLGNGLTASGAVSAITLGPSMRINSGTIDTTGQITLTATAGTFTVTPTIGYDNIFINGPSSGGAVTLAMAAANFAAQKIVMSISQGATAATWALGNGFNFGTSIASYTATAVAGKRDTLMLINNVGTVFDVEAINQGFSP